jgi:hypothetical protein
LSVVLGGTVVPLPDNQELNNITVNVTDDEFTITQDGVYYISYNVNTTLALLLGARILLNGTQVDQLTRTPVLSASNFHADGILPLAAGDTITLELFGLISLVTLQGGVGASLTIIRLDD